MPTTHVTSLELSRRLKELGVPQKSLFYWSQEHTPSVNWKVMFQSHTEASAGEKVAYYSAYLASELGEMLPKGYRSGKAGNPKQGTFKAYVNVCYSAHRDGYSHTTFEDTEADARAKMLIYLLENHLISVEELGK